MTTSTPVDTVAPDSVTTHKRVCEQCGAELPPPAPRARVLARFCKGSRCRSRWHMEQRRRLVAEVHQRLESIALWIREVATLVDHLQGR
jgi:hypothetical protein